MYFKIYIDRARQWRWALFAANHRRIADSGEGYFNEVDCRKGISLVVGISGLTPVYPVYK